MERFNLTVEQIAEEFNVSHRTIRRLIESGQLPAAKVGSQWRLNREQVNEAFAVPFVEPPEENKSILTPVLT